MEQHSAQLSKTVHSLQKKHAVWPDSTGHHRERGKWWQQRIGAKLRHIMTRWASAFHLTSCISLLPTKTNRPQAARLPWRHFHFRQAIMLLLKLEPLLASFASTPQSVTGTLFHGIPETP